MVGVGVEYDPSEAQRKLRQLESDLRGDPLKQGFVRAATMFMRDARKNAPVDTGRLRASIVVDLRSRDGEGFDVITGTNVEYAMHQEFGTKPFWPPPGALSRWAKRHGTTDFLVRRSIARHGIRAKRYFQRAFDARKEEVKAYCERVVQMILRRS